MGGFGHFVVVFLFPFAFGADFLVDPGSYSAHRLFVKTVSAESVAEAGQDEGLSPLSHHMQKRSADSCNGLEGYERKLKNNTHEVSSLVRADAFMHRCYFSKPCSSYVLKV